MNNIKTHEHIKGFTLIELMIVIAIVGILASIAIPQYADNVKKSRFTEIKVATAAVKRAIESCYELNNGNPLCNTVSGTSQQFRGQLTAAMVTGAENGATVQSVTLTGTTSPIITVTAVAEHGLANKTYVLTGNIAVSGTDRSITSWSETGSACAEGWC